MPSLESRFWLTLVRDYLPAEWCWEWPGATDHGYGVLQRGARGEGLVTTHRLVWELTKGPIPEGLHVLHSCDNRACVNPRHLFLGTNLDNINDSMSKGRRGRKLTREQADEIKKAPGLHREIAQRFGVDRTLVGYIKRGRIWR